MSKPNILMIMLDQMRADCLGTAGHPDVKTPFIDTLAAKGVRFVNAYTACPTCIPARAALYTGLSQKTHGRVGYQDGIPWNYPVTIAGELSKAGYYTQCVGKMHVHPLRKSLGFHNIELHDGALRYYRKSTTQYYENQKVADDYYYWLKEQLGVSTDVVDTGMECNSWVARPWIYEEKYHPTNWVTTRCIDFLRRRDREKPFFLMASYVRPHPPFDAPQCYFDMYKDKKLAKPALGDWENDELLNKNGRIYDSPTGSLDDELIRQAQVGYYASITHVDHQIGRLVQEFIDDGIYDNTVVIFVSDHGELLSDHHLFRKSRPYQGSINIPLIISGSEKIIGKRNRTVENLVELRDILPTILDFAGQDVPDCVEGVSLLDCMNDSRNITHEYIHGEHQDGLYSNHYIVTEKDKYIWYSQTGLEQYFCLKDDPKELNNRINNTECEDRIFYLRSALISELNGRKEGYTDGERLIVGQTPSNYLF